MTSSEILKADVLDILFDSRNKQYGAYILRKKYNSRLTTALAIALSLVFLIFLSIKNNPAVSFLMPVKPDVILRQVEIPRPKPQLQKTVQKIVAHKQTAERSYWQKISMVEHPDVSKEIQPVTDLKDVAIATENKSGPVSSSLQTPVLNDGSGVKPSNSVDQKDFNPVEQNPEFPGGAAAWLNFLNKNLHTPDVLEANEKKMVVIRFLVDADGVVTGFEVVRSGGNIFDEEVIRVLKKMPKWKPAIQNGHAVAVSFTQPVTFVGVEQ